MEAQYKNLLEKRRFSNISTMNVHVTFGYIYIVYFMHSDNGKNNVVSVNAVKA